jgi:hypothetical protein
MSGLGPSSLLIADGTSIPRDGSRTGDSYGSPMMISYVLRLRPTRIREGEFVGEVEAVTSGRRFPIRSLEQMVSFVLTTMEDELAEARSDRREQREES